MTRRENRDVLTDSQALFVSISAKERAGAICVLLRDACVSARDVDWQEGAAGMRLAAALRGTGTNRSIIA